MSTGAGRERTNRGTRPRGTLHQPTPAAKPGQVGGEACFISPESAAQSKPQETDLSHRSEVKSREAVRGRATSGTWMGRLRYYGLALLLVAVGVILRMALTRWVGPGMPTYISFSSFVMLAALIGGWGPGLLATLATALVVSYWLLPPAGLFKIESPADAAGLAFFCVMGILVSIVAELYRRTRDHLDELVVVRTKALRRANEQLRQEVAERKQAEKSLRESEERFRTAFEKGSVAMALTALDSTLLKVNSRFCRMLGFSESELVGRSFTEITHPDDRAANLVGTRQLASGEISSFHMEKRYLRKDGTVLWAEMNTAAVPDAKGRPLYCVTHVQDITERKKAEEALRQAKTFTDKLLNAPLDTVFLFEPATGKPVRWNQRFAEVSGYGDEEIAGMKAPDDFYDEDDLKNAHECTRRTLADGQGVVVLSLITKQGAHIPFEYAGTVVQDEDGRTLLLSVGRDITERKRAEEALRESENRFRTMADGSPNPIWVTDAEGERIFANKQYLEYFGISEQEAEGGEWKPFLHPEDAPAYVNSFVSSLKEHRPFSAEARVRRADGRWRWIESHAEPRLSMEEEFLGFVGITQDITERKQAEQELRDLNATLESKVARRTAELQHRAVQLQKLALELTQAEERERRRIALILHEDLQQQIAGAKFHLNLVRNRAREDRQRTDVDTVDVMLKEAIEKSRNLSRDLSPTVLHMNDLAEALQWLVNRVQAQQALTVHLDVRGEMALPSEASAIFLFRAAQEMLFNVVQHAGVRDASVRVRRRGRYVSLCIADQGRGFDPQELKETSGMGLFSIRERAELLGGHLKVKSAKGKGSRFSIVVPAGRKPEDRRQKTEDGRQEGEDGLPSSVLRPPSSGPALRVLLVDDHDVVRAGLAALLREAPGIELVGEAPDGREAIQMANDLQPDVVIMDVSMPVMSGDQATRLIKAHLPQTRVIALSMYDEAEKKERMFEAGAEGYIPKTVSAEDLVAAIRGEGADSRG